ncbi:histidine kinase [Argonema antarcticum]|uniref:histidine kinase n=1 Tax=Argonema antarcticum TaxID=2942763 RepID=UPI002012D1AC|nr:histidine kinase [Argonema antarcticum]MCL1472100.1 histidine kinase [Argonema antarcticum A004/B2]
MAANAEKSIHSHTPLQLLLFVDERPSSQEQLLRLHNCIQELKTDYPFELEVVDVGEQPYLAEHFKLVATPALIKIHPPPQQTIAGSNLVPQLIDWWPRWKQYMDDFVNLETESWATTTNQPQMRSFSHVAELIRISDENFRLKQEKEELQQQLLFKDRIVAMLAHDLRNPLTAASIALETLESNYNTQNANLSRLTPALTAQLIKQARNQTRAIDRLIIDILQGAQGNSSSLKIVPEKLDLGDLCRDVVNYLKHLFEVKSQQVKTDIPKDLPYVYADRERVRQVLVNLLENAHKYTPEGGTIEVFILHRIAQKVQLTVGDTGPGIPEENRSRIFEQNFRLKRDEAQDGYGIGLSLCQRIIRAHYGRIWVESAPDRGSCFHFTLPIYRS